MLDTLIEDCHDFLFKKLLPQWLKHGIHPELGYSYESLNHDWSVNQVGRVRLLTQCRQLYTFSHAYIESKDQEYFKPLTPLFEFIISHYWQNNAWIFSLNDDLSIKDTHSDAYALAFVLLAFSYYFKATGDKRATQYIEMTHLFLVEKMSCQTGGFLETFPSAPDRMRRQNPHMHLLEGYLAAYSVAQDSAYKEEIKKLLNLMTSHFFDSDSHSLLEFFNDDWSPDKVLGDQIEPGHHFEWVWLLHQTRNLFPEKQYLKVADALWFKACKYGFDPQGGIYNQIDAQTGKVIDAEKRIWPITEYLKALCAHENDSSKVKSSLASSLQFMISHYLEETGSWNEYLDKQNQPKQHPLPGTTSYHLFLGILEVLKWAKTNL